MTSTATLRSVNALTTRWASALPDQGTVFTAAGVWPLLALLAHGAAGAARAELAEALGVPAESAAEQARQLLATLNELRGVETALGLWTRDTLPVERAWLDSLPTGVHEQLTGDLGRDQERLDAWAKDRTDGQIGSMPIALQPSSLLLLASALVVRTDWTEPFTPGWLERTPDRGRGCAWPDCSGSPGCWTGWEWPGQRPVRSPSCGSSARRGWTSTCSSGPRRRRRARY